MNTTSPLSSFTVHALPNTQFSPGSIAKLPDTIHRYGKKTLLLTGRHFSRSDAWSTLISNLDQRQIGWNHQIIGNEPTPDIIDTIVRQFRHENPNSVTAIGGGSVMDTGKAVAGLIPSGDPVMDYLEDIGNILTGRRHKNPRNAREALVMVLEDWTERLAIPTLSKYGINHDNLPLLVQHGRGNNMKTNPLDLTDEELTTILAERL